MTIFPSISAGFINSYKAFPYLPRDINDNNFISPYHQFIDLPNDNGIPKWTELAPNGWSQFGPYYNIFLKYYLKADGNDEQTPDGGGRIHSLKAASFGSSLSLPKARNITSNRIDQAFEFKDWSLFSITKTFNITTETNVNLGCFYRILEQDPLRPLNFGGIYLYFTKGFRSSYLNYYVIFGGGNGFDVLGSSSSYTYLNTYNPLKTYEAFNQWLGQPVIKFKYLGLKSQQNIFNQWQFLNYQVPIPDFVNSPDDDLITGKPDTCTIGIYFAENNSYLDDQSGDNTGSIQFLYPFLSLS